MRVLTGPLAGKKWLSTAGPHGCWIGTYERELQDELVRALRPGQVVYDVGANAGFFTLLAAQLLGDKGQVISIEPLPCNLELLRRHLALNGIRNVRVVDAAVADAAGETRFKSAASSSMGRLDAAGDIAVRVDTIDGLVEDGLPPPDVIKMDVEGAESRALAGARKTLAAARPLLFLSTHGWAEHEACWSLLQDHGYAMTLRRDGAADGQYESVARPLSTA